MSQETRSDLMIQLSFAFALLFVLNDSYNNMKVYFEFPFTVNVRLESPPSQQSSALPALTLCIPNLINATALQAEHPLLYNAMERNDSRRSHQWRQTLAERFSIGTILNWSIPFETLFDCGLFIKTGSETTTMSCDAYSPIERTVSMFKHCFVLFGRPTSNVSNDRVSSDDKSKASEREDDWFKVHLRVNRSKLWSGWVDFILSDPPRAYVVFAGRSGFRAVSTNLHAHVQFGFSRIRVRRLPAPYASACVHYAPDRESTDCESQEHCVQKCHALASLHQFHRWPASLQTLPVDLYDLNQVHLESSGDSFQRLRGDCAIQYSQPNCVDTYFEVDILSEKMRSTDLITGADSSPIKPKRKRKKNSSKAKTMSWAKITIQSIQEQQMELVYEPRIEAWDLLINIGQSVSLYVGFCVYDLNRFVRFVYIKLKARRAI
jgi:hypothetical protein